MTAAESLAAAEPGQESARGALWLVVYPSGGLAGVSLDRPSASRHAAAVDGVLAALPIVEDYRS